MPQSGVYHVPVLLQETLLYLDPKPGETMLDATLGGGGHSAALLERLTPGGILIALDRDLDAIDAGLKRLEPLTGAAKIFMHSGFGSLEESFQANEEAKPLYLDGALFDLGVSSHQLDTERGFSFRRDEPLSMRMDDSDGAGRTAADILATESEAEIGRILWDYGEERWAKRIAQRVVERRNRGEKLQTTGQLAALVESCIPRAAWPRDIHVATRSFQALRIAVNDELVQLKSGLSQAVTRLKPGGRMVVISYHSLEDRIVKQSFAEWAGKTPPVSGMSPAALLPVENSTAIVKLLTRKPVLSTDAEIARNPRARSAKLRAIQRLSNE